MIGRIHEHAIFGRLRREGTYVRVGPLWCSVLLDPTLESAHVAYALGRNTGNAVVRNRLRRQLREVVRTKDGTLPAGYYLLGASSGATTMAFNTLSGETSQLLAKAARRASERSAGKVDESR